MLPVVFSFSSNDSYAYSMFGFFFFYCLSDPWGLWNVTCWQLGSCCWRCLLTAVNQATKLVTQETKGIPCCHSCKSRSHCLHSAHGRLIVDPKIVSVPDSHCNPTFLRLFFFALLHVLGRIRPLDQQGAAQRCILGPFSDCIGGIGALTQNTEWACCAG